MTHSGTLKELKKRFSKWWSDLAELVYKEGSAKVVFAADIVLECFLDESGIHWRKVEAEIENTG